MIENTSSYYDRGLVKSVIEETRRACEKLPFKPTGDIDMVWVLSAPGTWNTQSEDGVYGGEAADRFNISAGINLVKQITAARMGVEVKKVTKEDIREHGPTLFYNGEDENTAKVNYLQNEALEVAIQLPEFPIPEENVVIDHIDTIGTPAQIAGIAKYIKENDIRGKIAVISSLTHSRRVSRYLRLAKDEQRFPEGVEFVNACFKDPGDFLGKMTRETRKVLIYTSRGHMAREPLSGF